MTSSSRSGGAETFPVELRVMAEGLPFPVAFFDDELRPVWTNAVSADRTGALAAGGAGELLEALVPDAELRRRVQLALREHVVQAERPRASTRAGGVGLSTPRPGLHMLALDVREGSARGEDESAGIRGLMEANPDVCAHFDAGGRLRRVNSEVKTLCGWEAEELRGAPLRRLVSRRSLEALRVALPALATEGRLENLELELRRADGGVATTIAHVGLLSGDDGEVRGAVAVLRDITRRKILQERLLEADRLAAIGKLAARVAHEINNPLQALMMHMSIVGPEIPPDVEVVDSWERMRDAARQIQCIVSDLLDLHEGREPAEGPADLNAVVRETLALTRRPLAHRRIQAALQLDRDLPGVEVRHRHLRQITLNLVLHAMDNMRHGGQLALRTGAARGGTRVTLDVSDTGPEIAEDRLARLFDPHPREGEGSETALGLFVAHYLVRASGGRISVDSAAGRGTRFRVALPISGLGVQEPR